MFKLAMYRLAHTTPEPRHAVMQSVRERIEQGGERLWRMDDFADLPSMAVAQALSRLERTGLIQRLSKGTYYRAGQSAFGKTRPNPAALRKLASRGNTLFPAGTTAANLLGFTTQTARRGEVSTSAGSVQRKLIGEEIIVHTRRPDAWKSLTETETAMLDFLRRGGRTSELSPDATIKRTQDLLAKPNIYAHLLDVAPSEPPRVRAMLGAFGEQLGANRKKIGELRRSLNPLSKFDFGTFADMPNAKNWQAKGRR
jgi:Family of unknown function (DUF6088)